MGDVMGVGTHTTCRVSASKDHAVAQVIWDASLCLEE